MTARRHAARRPPRGRAPTRGRAPGPSQRAPRADVTTARDERRRAEGAPGKRVVRVDLVDRVPPYGVGRDVRLPREAWRAAANADTDWSTAPVGSPRSTIDTGTRRADLVIGAQRWRRAQPAVPSRATLARASPTRRRPGDHGDHVAGDQRHGDLRRDLLVVDEAPPESARTATLKAGRPVAPAVREQAQGGVLEDPHRPDGPIAAAVTTLAPRTGRQLVALHPHRELELERLDRGASGVGHPHVDRRGSIPSARGTQTTTDRLVAGPASAADAHAVHGPWPPAGTGARAERAASTVSAIRWLVSTLPATTA